ncbi:sialidase family protein [Roseiconus sp. JC912]
MTTIASTRPFPNSIRRLPPATLRLSPATLRLATLLQTVALATWLGTCVSKAAEPDAVKSQHRYEIVVGNADLQARQPQLAIGHTGRTYLAFGSQSDIYVCHEEGTQSEFSAPVKVGHLEKLALGMRRGPRIAICGDAIVVTAISHKTGNLVAYQSKDHGATWSDTVIVNDVDESAREGLHSMASDRNGNAYVVWLDLRNGHTEIFISKSVDAGITWSKNSLVYRSPSETVCECCHPSIQIGNDGTIYVMWRNLIDGDRDMYLSSSLDGMTFSAAKKLGTGTWSLDACPMDGGDLTVSDKGLVTTVWRRKDTVYQAVPNNAFEIVIGKGEQPSVTASKRGVWIAWLSRRNGPLLHRSPDSDQTAKLADQANDPVIASDSKGEIVVAAWEEKTKQGSTIVVKQLAK